MPPPDDLTLDYRWSEGSVPPPWHYRVRIRLDAEGATVAMTPGYGHHKPPTWTVPLAVSDADRATLLAALRDAGLFEADWAPPARRKIGGSGWRLDVTADGQTVAMPRDAVASGGDAAAIEAAVRALVPASVWADLRARRNAYQAARR